MLITIVNFALFGGYCLLGISWVAAQVAEMVKS
jgi:hypothetical protein